METKVNEKSTPKKTMQNKLYEQVQGKFAHSTFNSDSPFRLLPNFSTPPSRYTKIFNPFEPGLSERLHLPVFSPNVFNSDKPRGEEKFMWSIEDISNLKPADIDVHSTDQYTTDNESAFDSLTQEKINTFFSEKIIVPSPMNPVCKTEHLISTDSPRRDNDKHCTDVTTQTILSLPPILPKHVEEALKPYLNCDESEKPLSDTALYSKLFEFDHTTPESVQSSPALSVALSPIQFSPFHCKSNTNARKSDEMFGGSSPLRDCDISPIRHSMSEAIIIERRSATRLNFSSHMSVDVSAIGVPDESIHIEEKSAHLFESIHHSPEQLSETTVNWDMEYKHVTLESANSSCNEMDVSAANTPRSRIFVSQRKKLSDSFMTEDFDEEVEDRQNQHVKKLFSTTNTIDGGYHTGCSHMDDDSLHLFASTPTKFRK